MAAKTTGRALPDAYFTLVEAFPLTHIRDAAHLDAAQKVLDRLLTTEADRGTREYLDALTDLVETYEEKHVRLPDASEADVLRELMRANGLGQQELARQTRVAQSTLSAVLSGGRSLTKAQVVTLARYFGVSPAAFLPG